MKQSRENIMGNAVHVTTAVRENYGAHDWDGAGECPQYWKCKGGDEYIIIGAPSVDDAVDFVYSYIVGDPNEYVEETVLGGVEVSPDFKTELEEYASERFATRVEWKSRFNKYPTNKLLKNYEAA